MGSKRRDSVPSRWGRRTTMLTSRWRSRLVIRLRRDVSPAPLRKRKCSHRMLPEIRRLFRNTKRSRLHTGAIASLPRRESGRRCIEVVPLDPRCRGVQTSRGRNRSTPTATPLDLLKLHPFWDPPQQSALREIVASLPKGLCHRASTCRLRTRRVSFVIGRFENAGRGRPALNRLHRI